MSLGYTRLVRTLLFISYFFVSLFYVSYYDLSFARALFQSVSVACCWLVLFPFWKYTRQISLRINGFLEGFRNNRKGAIYIWLVSIVFLFIMAFLWFVFYYAITPVRTASNNLTAAYSNHTSYAALELADTFMFNLWFYFLALAFIGILLWSYHAAQRRGPPY